MRWRIPASRILGLMVFVFKWSGGFVDHDSGFHQPHAAKSIVSATGVDVQIFKFDLILNPSPIRRQFPPTPTQVVTSTCR